MSTNKTEEVYVKKWVDYSSKYGLGYLLSNSSSGVFFNDSTKIILDPKGEYFSKISDNLIVTLSIWNVNPKKKLTLFQHILSPITQKH